MIPPGQIVIHSIDPRSVSRDEAAACLTAAELEHAGRFRFEKDASHWIACRAGLRKILGAELGMPAGAVELVRSAYGKPLLPSPHDNLHFNLTHGQDLALVALCADGPVGIDLEPLDRAASLLGCENSFCHPEEIAALSPDTQLRAWELLRLWTGKEAVLKALGTGLSHPPENLRLPSDPAHPAKSTISSPELDNQRLHWLDQPELSGYLAALSAPRGSATICFAE